MSESHARDLIADFAHQLRQPLSTLEALISCLELIIPVGDERAQEQLRRMHFEVGTVDQILAEGVRSLRTLLAHQPGSRVVDVIRPTWSLINFLNRPICRVVVDRIEASV